MNIIVIVILIKIHEIVVQVQETESTIECQDVSEIAFRLVTLVDLHAGYIVSTGHFRLGGVLYIHVHVLYISCRCSVWE